MVWKALEQSCYLIRRKTYEDAKEAIGDFCDSVVSPWRFKNSCLQYILTIRNIVRKWKKTMVIKKQLVEDMENSWSKEVIK